MNIVKIIPFGMKYEGFEIQEGLDKNGERVRAGRGSELVPMGFHLKDLFIMIK